MTSHRASQRACFPLFPHASRRLCEVLCDQSSSESAYVFVTYCSRANALSVCLLASYCFRANALSGCLIIVRLLSGNQMKRAVPGLVRTMVIAMLNFLQRPVYIPGEDAGFFISTYKPVALSKYLLLE